MNQLKNILIILVFITLIRTSFSIWNAFLWDDLWVNLYQNIDSWIIELETSEYSYELKWQEKWWTIEAPINKILKQKWFWDCSISESLSEDDILRITSWDLALLSSKLSPNCLSSWNSITISMINSLQSEITNHKNNVQAKAVEKAKQTYNISRIWLYSDWDTKNSPFDIIQDIKDIDTIIFTQPIEYEGNASIDDWWFWDYLAWKFKEVENQLNKDINESGLVKEINEVAEELLWVEENENTNELDEVEIVDDVIIEVDSIPVGIYWVDHTQYACIDNVESSGLTQEYLDSLWLPGTSKEWTSDLSVLFPPVETIYDWEENSEAEFIQILDEEIEAIQSDYSSVNDSSVWDCSNFFCITVEFITSPHSTFGWEKMNSIQSIVEKSNEHLKKFVNGSLIQSKMTTNNFELWLRDLKLSEVFSFGMVITKKTPPILNLEENEENSNDENPLSAKNIYCSRWESTWWKCIRQNDLEIFVDSDAEAKTVLDSWELSLSTIAAKNAERQAWLQAQSLLDDFITQAIQRDAWLKETEELHIEFLEIERFVSSIKDYSTNLSAIINKMNDIPSHP